MLLKCNECGHDNQLGAIFCRECGTKLDVEKMRPEVDVKAKKDIGGMVKNIIAVVVLLTLAIVLGLMFWPQSAKSYELTDKEIAKTDSKFQKLVGRMNGNKRMDATYIFTPDEVTYLFNNKLTSKSEDGGPSYTIEKLHITLDNYDNIVLIAESSFLGIPVSFGLQGYLIDEKLDLKVRSAKMGHLGVPSFLRGKIISKFTPGIQEGTPADIIKAATKVEVENGDFHITVSSLK